MPEQATRADTGSAIRAARLDAGLTLRRLATAINVSTGTMSAIENGKVGVTVDRLSHISDALGVPAARLVRPRRAAVNTATPQPPAEGSGWRSFDDINLDSVLASAVEVFRETGYHGATMRLIATGADISVAGIYHHYPSKKHLLIELISRAHADLGWRLNAAAADAAGAAGGFSNMVEALVLFREERRALAFVMVTESYRAGVPLAGGSDPDNGDIRATLQAAALQAVESGSFGNTEPELAVDAILTMCLAPPSWTGADQASDPAELARDYARLALSMMQYRH